MFLGHSFLPYEDGMSFFVSIDGINEWHLRLQWRPEEQGDSGRSCELSRGGAALTWISPIPLSFAMSV